MSDADTGASRGDAGRVDEVQRTHMDAWRPLTPLLAAAAFAVTAMTLVGSLLAS